MPRGGAGTSEALSSFASLERTLDRTIEQLTRGPQTREVRAQIIEARRLRSVVANWRSIPPPPDVRDEMLGRVIQLSNAVGSALDPMDEPEAPSENVPSLRLDFEPAPPRPDVSSRRPPPRGIVDPRVDPRMAPRPPPTPPPRAPEPAPPPGRRMESTRPGDRRSADPSYEGGARPRAPLDPDDASAPRPRAPLAPVVEDDLDPLDFEPRLYTQPGGRSSAPPRHRTSGRPEPQARSPRPEIEALPPQTPVPPADAASHEPRGREPITTAGAGGHPVPSYETEGYHLAVPRTQIDAHPVKLPEPLNAQLVYHLDPYSDRADAYRSIRRKLVSNAALRVVGVTSASPGEGKSVFAMNLALALRERVRERVLIVDANLRHPSLGELLGFAAPVCFMAQLASHAEDPRAPWVVAAPESLPKLHVMAIDPTTPHDPLLDPVTFSMGMERLKQAGYEYIVVDAPPVLGGVDGNVVSDSVDAMILTALPLKSKRKEMRKAVEQLEPAPILGVVVLEA